MEVSATTPREEAEGVLWSSEQGPGAYVMPLTRDQPSLPPDHSHDDVLENVIALAQLWHARDMITAGWPISLPVDWYWHDPKRAGRCLARAGLARDPTTQDLSFRTETLRLRQRSGALSVMHRSVVHFTQWNHTFVGESMPTVAQAERAAFRSALDAYKEWIEWTQDERRVLHQKASRGARK